MLAKCPKCGGDVVQIMCDDISEHHWELKCIQCGKKTIEFSTPNLNYVRKKSLNRKKLSKYIRS